MSKSCHSEPNKGKAKVSLSGSAEGEMQKEGTGGAETSWQVISIFLARNDKLLYFIF